MHAVISEDPRDVDDDGLITRDQFITLEERHARRLAEQIELDKGSDGHNKHIMRRWAVRLWNFQLESLIKDEAMVFVNIHWGGSREEARIKTLSIALVITNILKYGLHSMRVNEGFESADDKTKLVDDEDDKLLKDPEDKVLDTKTKKVVKKDDSVVKKDEKQLTDKEKKLKEYQDLKKDFPEFKEIQNRILKGISEIDPLLSKAENFIDRFQDLKKN